MSRAHRSRKFFTLAALAFLALGQSTGCSSSPSKDDRDGHPNASQQISPEETAASPTSPAPKATDPASFDGPYVGHCPQDSSTTIVSKFNIQTGELVDIGKFPFSCKYIDSAQASIKFSPDFRKAALDVDTWENHAKYYDSATGTTVDVSAIVSPVSTGDFGNKDRPIHANPQFDESGLFVFYDAAGEDFVFFDTNSKKVVRTEKEYVPKLFKRIANIPSPYQGQWVEQPYWRICDFLYIMNDTQYLRQMNDNNNVYLEIATLPGENDAIQCGGSPGQRITPPNAGVTDAISDPSGSKILFVVVTDNDQHRRLYQVNFQDLQHPIPVRMSGNIVEQMGANPTQAMNFLGWP